MTASAITAPALLDDKRPLQDLQRPADARALLLVAHPNAASMRAAGHGFVLDVLRANGLATLPFCLHTHAEQAAGLTPAGKVQARQRLRALHAWITQQPSLAGLPMALIGLGSAAPRCIAAAANGGMAGLHALMLLDGQAGTIAPHLRQLYLPTLFVLGHGDALGLARCRAATRSMPAAHRIEVLDFVTQPCPACGALEAFACAVLAWLEQTLPQPRSAPHPHDIAAMQPGWA